MNVFRSCSGVLILGVLPIFIGCSAIKTTYNVQAGVSWGGIIENTEVDAVSGATSIGLNLGVHPAVSFGRRMAETGLDFLTYNQSFTYLDLSENYDGSRDLKYGELRIPLSYNFQLLRDGDDIGRLQLKLGLSAGYRIFENIKNSGTLPPFSFDRFSVGPAVGVSTAPVRLNDKMNLGFYLDATRASKVYTDHYSSASDVGNMSNIKFGVLLNFR